MAWINIATQRLHLRENTLKSLQAWESGIDLIGNHKLGLSALMTGDLEIFERTKKFSKKWLDYYLQKKDDVLIQPIVFPSFVNLCFLSQLAGKDEQETIERIINLKRIKDKNTLSLQLIVKNLLNSQSSIYRNEKKLEGHIETEKDWLRLLVNLSAENLIDLALCPDHHLWTMSLSNYCIPLGKALVQKNLKNDKYANKLDDYIAFGSRPYSHKKVLFERKHKKTFIENDPTNEKFSWLGFDAIEVIENEMFVYYWLGFDWRASLDFVPGQLNAFCPFEFLDKSWNLVREATNKETWTEIESYYNTGKISYVVVVDKFWSKKNISSLRRAENYFNIKLYIKDFSAI